MNVVDRAKNILLTPKSEWETIKGESAGIQQIYTQYLVIVAAFPAVGQLLGMARLGFGNSLRLTVTSYLVSLASVYVSALIVDNLANSFSSTKDMKQAFKLVAYALTPSYVAAVLAFLPGLGWLVGLAGAAYSVYLFYLGLPVLMRTPQDKVIPYMLAAFIVSIVVYFFLFAILGFIFGVSLLGR
jgi:hypothetical protein